MKNASQRNLVGQNQKCTTRKPNANLRKNSTLYFQVGLIIALVLSIFMLEYRSPVTAHDFEKLSVEEENFKEWNETFRMIPEQAQSISKQVASSKILPPQEVP
ncbi:MAG: hypothetical protein WA951_00355, partial [Leeuwenhoekiella sp.]